MKKIFYIALIFSSFLSYGQTNYYVSKVVDSTYNDISDLPSLSPGDSVFFQAGQTWRESFSLTQGDSDDRIYYGRYGTGDNPEILGSDLAEDWTETATSNIWESATSLNNPRVGSASGFSAYGGEVFFEDDDSTTWGHYEAYTAGFTNLTQEYDWTWNGNTIYVYATSDPDTRYDEVEVAQRSFCARFSSGSSSYVAWDGIDIHYAQFAGLYSGYPEAYNQTDLTIRNCYIGYIGIKGGSGAYGIEAHHSNFLVENCTITDCGRRGISYNFYTLRPEGEELYCSDIVIRNNVFKRGQHTTSLDMAMEAVSVGDTVTDVYFYNNLVDDHEIAWTEDDETSNQLYFQPTGGYLNNVYVWNNIFIHSTARNILFTTGDSVHLYYNTVVGHNLNMNQDPYGNVSFSRDVVVDFRNNIQYDNLPDNTLDNYGLLNDYESVTFEVRDYNLYYQNVISQYRGFTGGHFGYWDTTEWNTFLVDLSPWEANSPRPQDPYFTDFDDYDFTLSDSSSAIGAATPIDVTVTAIGESITIGDVDYLGNERDATSPDIGAFEFQGVDSTATDITSFTIPNQVSSTINTTSHTVAVVMPFGTDRSSLTPTIGIDGETISPTSGTAQNFTSSVNYTVTAYNSSTQQWTVTVTNAAARTGNDILTFSIPNQISATINDTEHTVTVVMPQGTDRSSLTPTFTVSEGATASPLSGTAQNFTSSVEYTITSEASVGQAWTVSVGVQEWKTRPIVIGSSVIVF